MVVQQDGAKIGSLGTVYKAQLTQEMKTSKGVNVDDVAYKVTECSCKTLQIRAQRECLVIRDCCHPNIVKHYFDKQSDGKVELVMEWMDLGSLETFMNSFAKTGFSWDRDLEMLRGIVFQIVAGLAYLHTVMDVYHRDIKSENILVNKEGRVKLCDFDAVFIKNRPSEREAQLVQEDVAETTTGTQGCMAPEMVSKGYNEKVDSWSLGIAIFKIVTGKVAAANGKLFKAYDEKNDDLLGTDYSMVIDKDLCCLLKDLIRVSPDHRLSALQLLEHPFFSIGCCIHVLDVDDDMQKYLIGAKVNVLGQSMSVVLREWKSYRIKISENSKDVRNFNGIMKRIVFAMEEPAICAVKNWVAKFVCSPEHQVS